MKKLSAYYSLVDAVFLTIDSATVSGAHIASPEYDDDKDSNKVTGYETRYSGTVETQVGRQEVVELAVEVAAEADLPLIIIAEEWTPHGMSTAAFISLNVNWGKWEAELEQAEVPEEHIVRVKPNPWRDDLFGKKRPHTRAPLKKTAQIYIVSVLHMPAHGHDISEAVCLRAWGSRAGAVHKIVKKLKKAA